MTKRLSHEHDIARAGCRFSDFCPTWPRRLNPACLAVGFPSEGGVLHLGRESGFNPFVTKGFLRYLKVARWFDRNEPQEIRVIDGGLLRNTIADEDARMTRLPGTIHWSDRGS